MSNISEYIEMTEKMLADCVPKCEGELSFIPEILTYSLSGGGKRIRPLLCLEFARACGGEAENALYFACAVEFVHTYSLIHDDLPCMDDDDYRRGKLSSHKKFGEAQAVLAGDALLTAAFGLISKAFDEKKASAESCVRATSELSRLAGANGMIGGQYIDIAYEKKQADGQVLFLMDSLKTSALIESACVLGCICANAHEEKICAAREFALSLGVAFQIIDDILEVSGEEISGDELKEKSTYVSVFGREKAERLAEEYTERAKKALEIFGDRGKEIGQIADMLLKREK